MNLTTLSLSALTPSTTFYNSYISIITQSFKATKIDEVSGLTIGAHILLDNLLWHVLRLFRRLRYSCLIYLYLCSSIEDMSGL